MRFRGSVMRFLVWRCRCNCPFNNWARIVTQFFECRVIEHADQQCHERHNGSKDRNYREKVPYHGTQHSRRSEDYTPYRGCKADGRDHWPDRYRHTGWSGAVEEEAMTERAWLSFDFAANEIGQRLGVSGGVARRMLRNVCAS